MPQKPLHHGHGLLFPQILEQGTVSFLSLHMIQEVSQEQRPALPCAFMDSFLSLLLEDRYYNMCVRHAKLTPEMQNYPAETILS